MKTSILSAFLLLVVINCFAQNVYLKVSPGYSVAASKEILTSQEDISYNIPFQYQLYEYKIIKGTLGKGLDFNATIGVQLKKNFGLELGIGYLKGSEIEVVSTEKYPTSSTTHNIVTTNTYRGNLIHFSPMVVMHQQIDEQSKITFGLGGYMGLASMTFDYKRDNPIGYNIRAVEEYKSRFSAGFRSSVEVDKSINDKITLFFNASFNFLKYKPKESEIVEFELNNNDSLSALTTNLRYSEYSDEYEEKYEYDDNGNSTLSEDTKSPAKRGSVVLSFSNVCFSVGVRFNLFAKKD